MSPIRTTLFTSIPLALLLAGADCSAGAIIDDDDAGDDDDAVDDDDAGDDDDAVDDDDAGDDDDAVVEIECGPEPGDQRGTGVVYAGQAEVTGESENSTWEGCEVEHWYSEGEYECAESYDLTGEVLRANNRATVFAVTFEYNAEESTCGEGEDYEAVYRARFNDAGEIVLAYADEFEGQDTDWWVFANSEIERTAFGYNFEYLTELIDDGGDDEDDEERDGRNPDPN
jgi:hypothetical protein